MSPCRKAVKSGPERAGSHLIGGQLLGSAWLPSGLFASPVWLLRGSFPSCTRAKPAIVPQKRHRYVALRLRRPRYAGALQNSGECSITLQHASQGGKERSSRDRLQGSSLNSLRLSGDPLSLAGSCGKSKGLRRSRFTHTLVAAARCRSSSGASVLRLCVPAPHFLSVSSCSAHGVTEQTAHVPRLTAHASLPLCRAGGARRVPAGAACPPARSACSRGTTHTSARTSGCTRRGRRARSS